MPAERKPVVVVGSINMDLVANTKRIPVEGETILGTGFETHPGGKGANQAVAVARLGYPVRLIGRLGDDAFGSELKNHLEQAGVDVTRVKSIRGSSGVAIIVVAEKAENSIVVIPGANAQLTPEDLDAEIETIRSAGIVLTQLEIPIETVQHLADLCARESVPLILDPAPAEELSPDVLRNTTWFTPNETEAAFYLGMASAETSDPGSMSAKLMSKGVGGVVLKLGARGAYLANSAMSEFVTAFPLKAVDTTAAGDAFNGAFAAGLLMGMEPAKSARFASAAAALSVTRAGAQSSMPLMAEVNELLAGKLRDAR